ncbi:MAG TPA: SDR family oxidoreductase [Phycisphaerae bacterium]|nr:SDR family oxidoreductase [Phycisphaerae bacterium]
MDLELSGKVAIVTGASRGIGAAIAQRLAAEGMRLVLAARDAAALDQIAAMLPASATPLVVAADLRPPEAPARVVTQTLSAFSRIDLLVNNAGATQRGDFLALTDDQWQDGFALKFFAAMRLSRAAWTHLATSRGSIVNIAGIGGRTGEAEFTIGGSVNAAILNLTKSLAHRGATDGVRVNAINPGLIRTDRLMRRIAAFAQNHQTSPEDAATRMAARFGVARFGEVHEIADTVAFLASSRSAYTHGAVIDIDGGATRTL